MSRIRSKWTLGEKKLHNLLKGLKIKHKMHPRIAGSPDIIILEQRKAVLIHGCFWHKCRTCYREPKSRKKYWLPKLKKNVERDRKNEKILLKAGWRIIRIWEHELKQNNKNLPKFLRKKLFSK